MPRICVSICAVVLVKPVTRSFCCGPFDIWQDPVLQIRAFRLVNICTFVLVKQVTRSFCSGASIYGGPARYMGIWWAGPPPSPYIQIPIYGGPAHQILAWRASIRQHTQHTFCHKAWLLCQYLYVCTSKASKQGVLRSQHYPLNESDVGPPRVALSAVFVLLY